MKNNTIKIIISIIVMLSTYQNCAVLPPDAPVRSSRTRINIYRRFPELAEAETLRLNNLIKGQKAQQARRDLTRAKELFSRDIEAVQLSINIKEAFRLLNEITQQQVNDLNRSILAEAKFWLGHFFINRFNTSHFEIPQNIKKAQELFFAAQNTPHPNQMKAKLMLATLCRNNNETKKSLDLFREVIEQKKDLEIIPLAKYAYVRLLLNPSDFIDDDFIDDDGLNRAEQYISDLEIESKSNPIIKIDRVRALQLLLERTKRHQPNYAGAGAKEQTESDQQITILRAIHGALLSEKTRRQDPNYAGAGAGAVAEKIEQTESEQQITTLRAIYAATIAQYQKLLCTTKKMSPSAKKDVFLEQLKDHAHQLKYLEKRLKLFAEQSGATAKKEEN